LIKLFKRLEFRKLLREMLPQDKDFKPNYEVVSNKRRVDELLGEIIDLRSFVFLLHLKENPDSLSPGIAGLAFCADGSKIYYVSGNNFAISQLLETFKPIFQDDGIRKISHDLKLSKIILERHAIDLKGLGFDTMLAAYLLDSNLENFRLQNIALEYLDRRIPEPLDSAGAVLCACESVRELAGILGEKIKSMGLEDLFYKLELPLIDVLAWMQAEGISVDKEYLQALSEEIEGKLKASSKEIFESAGRQFNVNSPKQLRQILFEILGLPVIKKGKSGPSTDEEVLKKLSSRHPLPGLILDYRQMAKLKSAFIDSLLALFRPQTGKIHACFNQTGTQTGRLSSSQPNLQNIPVKTSLGRRIRRAFLSSGPDWLLVSADYSQIELRILAHMSGDEALIEAFKKSQDIHVYTASLIFKVKIEDVTEEMREAAKLVNFGIIYGMGSHGLSKELAIGDAEAKEFIRAYFSRYPKVKQFCEGQIKFARERGYVKTCLGRIRFIPQINSQQANLRQLGERMAVNSPIQGSAADLIKLAMVNIYRQAKEENLRLKILLQVHDELVFDVHRQEFKPSLSLIKRNMEESLPLKVPIKVTIKAGKNWLEMEEIKGGVVQ
jgi:DNA polymerase-1